MICSMLMRPESKSSPLIHRRNGKDLALVDFVLEERAVNRHVLHARLITAIALSACATSGRFSQVREKKVSNT